jgi:hypothetical protein
VPGVDAPDAGGDAVVQDAAGDAETRPPTVVEQGFRLLLLRVDTKLSNRWLMLLDPTVPEWEAESGTAPVVVAGPQTADFPESRNPDIDCAMGCFADPMLQWLAFFEPGADPQSLPLLRVGPLDTTLVFQRDDSATIPDVTDLAFADGRLYVSQRVLNCDAQVGQADTCWVYRRIDLAAGPAILETLFTFPTIERVGQSGHAGHFTVSADGRTVVVQDPGNGTLGVWAWHEAWADDKEDGKLRQVGETICGSRLDEWKRCGSSPGLFADREPVAVSEDGTLVVVAAIEHDEALRWFMADLSSNLDAGFARTTMAYVNLDATTRDGFREFGYYNPKTVPFTRIQTSPRFTGTGDDAELVFVGERSANVFRKESTTTNLAALPVGTLRAGTGPKALAPFWRITRFAAADVPENVLIPEGGFDPSPDGTFVAFLGTPVLDSGGAPLTADMPQHLNDQEVHVIRRDGTTDPVQVSGQQETRTWDLAAVAWPSTD